MSVYDNLNQYTSVDCMVFSEAEYVCRFDEMDFTAVIKPKEEFLDSSYKGTDGKYQWDKEGKRIVGYNPYVGFDLHMIYDGEKCVFLPRMNLKCWFKTRPENKTIDVIYFKIGENRYFARIEGVITQTERAAVGTDEINYVTLPLGLKDIEMLKEAAQGKYDVTMRMGNPKETLI